MARVPRLRALVDRHHAGLLESLLCLLDDRLGFDVYVPVGMEWWDAGYWEFGKQHWGDDRLARQFLEPDHHWERDGLNLISEGDWFTQDPEFPGRWVAGASLARAHELGFDVVLSTLPDNYEGYARFAREKGARFVVQVGNTGQESRRETEPDVTIDSTREHPHAIQYHQEWDKDGLFMATPLPPQHENLAASFVNCMPSMGARWRDLQGFEKSVWPGRVAVHGIDGPAGNVKPIGEMARIMKQSEFGYHVKNGDGFGHVVHYWASVGRPLVGSASSYAGRLAGDLWEEGVTSVSTDGLRPHEVARRVLAIREDADRYAAMCQEIRRRVDARVDFAAEAAEIGRALGVESTP